MSRDEIGPFIVEDRRMISRVAGDRSKFEMNKEDFFNAIHS